MLSGTGWATSRYNVIPWLLSLVRGLQSVITYFCVDKYSDSGVTNLSLFHCSSGELDSAIASIFDGMYGEFTFSWNWFWITKARYKVVQQEVSLHQDSVESKQPHVMHSSAVMVQRETFAPGAKKLWLLPWDHVFCYFRGGLYSTHSNIYIYFVYLFFLLKQLCKPPNFFKWYY